MQDDNLEYVLDQLVGHNKNHKKKLYQVRWYRYGPANDTMDPEENIPTQPIPRYWCTNTVHKPENFSRRWRRTSN